MFDNLKHYYTDDFERTTMQPHEQRVVTEKNELDEKLGKLHAFCHAPSTPIFDSLPLEDRDLLTEQYEVMDRYSRVLGKRIARFAINTVAS